MKFPIPPRFILKDLMARRLLQPLPKHDEDPTKKRLAIRKIDIANIINLRVMPLMGVVTLEKKYKGL